MRTRIWVIGILKTATLLGLAAQGANQRQITLDAMDQRPADLWPRGQGHVLLAWPGTREAEKGYVEPGGSFSPGPGSFGISFWLVNRAHQATASSDTLPLDQIKHRWEWSSPAELPTLAVEAGLYDARWSAIRPGSWRLQLKTHPAESQHVCLVIRSVGPAGGPVRSLQWKNRRLQINQRWTIATEPALTEIYGGEEGGENWLTNRLSLTNWTGSNGWGYAVFDLPGHREWLVQVSDALGTSAGLPRFSRTQPTVDLALPDPRFADCLRAQAAHLLMGLVGRETRRADPMSYPLNWTSEGAYVVVALARSGLLDITRELSRSLCEPDFSGGFGPEADAPGLALWALNEVSGQLHDPQFQQAIWPYVLRKSETLQAMRTTRQPITSPLRSLLVPSFQNHPERLLVCEPARDGLIQGRVDWQRPRLYVNAISYLGLLSAVELAGWVGNRTADEVWRREASSIRTAWNESLHTSEASDERTVISGLWPSGIVRDKPAFAQIINQRWQRDYDDNDHPKVPPARPAFAVAEAHQWLYLDRPQRAGNLMDWFWEHQECEGWYSWIDGADTANLFHRWDTVRGWVRPAGATPSYRTAAELVLLQLDMLAYLDTSGAQPTLVIGQGIPASWLQQPLRVSGLLTRAGVVEWTWDGRLVHLRVRGRTCPVRLGPAFPPQALRLQFTRP